MQKLALAGLIVIAVLAACLIVWNSKAKTPYSDVKIFVEKEPADITDLSVKNASGGYRVWFDETEDGYVFDDIPVNLLDIEGFYALMDHACAFGSLRLVEQHANDLAKYGLENPRAEVAVTFADDAVFSLAIGDKEKVSGNYYGEVLSPEEAGNVYLFAEEDVLYYLLRKEAYISTQVTPQLMVSSPLSAVRDITFSGTALSRPVSITAVSGADREVVLAAKSFGPATHLVRMKGVYELDQTYGIEILGSVLDIRAVDVAAYNVTAEQLSALGFDEPYLQVDFSLKNGTDYIADYQLRLVPEGGYYLAYMLGSGVVFRIEPPAFAALKETKLCLRWFLSPLRTDVADLTVSFGDASYTFTSWIDDDGTIKAAVNGEEMDTEQFFRFYRLVTSACSEGICLEDPVNTGDPVMTITYNYNIEGKAPDVMKLYKGSLRRVNVEINGVTEFDMRAAFVDVVMDACTKALSDEAIRELW